MEASGLIRKAKDIDKYGIVTFHREKLEKLDLIPPEWNGKTDMNNHINCLEVVNVLEADTKEAFYVREIIKRF